ncbi:MAG: GNAT family N-acetyltransferase [Alphaproteobacteria bacterium]|nr:GNAT family N-acetyltransferase [Alphaproteobacteria bacterium]NNF23534.1 GNAT family N-acetyltransferase [Paracoccaceae bacterium]
MAIELFSLRKADMSDISSIDGLLRRSYPALLKKDYPPSVMVMAVPLISRANPDLIRRGTYILVEASGRRAVGAGGWSVSRQTKDAAEVRHLAIDPDFLRRGLGTLILERVASEARSAGLRQLYAHAALGAVPFYSANEFEALNPVTVPLRPGISFEAMRMVRPL